MPESFAGNELDKPTSLAWLDRFRVSLEAEIRVALGDGWRIAIDVPASQVIATRASDNASMSAHLHPGLHVVKPVWAAQRIGDQLQLSAIAAGLIHPLPGTVAI